MKVEKRFYDSFVTLMVGLSDGAVSEYISESIKKTALECIAEGIDKIAVSFYPQSYRNGCPIVFVILLSDYLKQRGGEVVILETEPSMRERWQPFVTQLGINMFSSFSEVYQKFDRN